MAPLRRAASQQRLLEIIYLGVTVEFRAPVTVTVAVYLHHMSELEPRGVAGLAAARLPLNRKERFYTGTVLPMLVGSDDFAHLHRFLRMCGAPAVEISADPMTTNVQFFTEYGFKESLVDGAADRFGTPDGKDTPDVVIYIEGHRSVLLGIEAKMYHRPGAGELSRQLRAQAALLSIMAEGLGTDPVVVHTALLPAGYGAPATVEGVRVLAWEAVADAYRDVAPAYWLGVLDQALGRYASLASKVADGSSYRQNNDSLVAGQALVDAWRAGDRRYQWMGRGGGLHGRRLLADISSGSWRLQRYEVRTDPLPGNRNWFMVHEFLEALDRSSGTHGADGTNPPAPI